MASNNKKDKKTEFYVFTPMGKFLERLFLPIIGEEEFTYQLQTIYEFKNGKLYRLMDCLNFKKKNNKLVFDSLEYKKYKKNGHLILHWLPKQKDLVKAEVLMPDKKLNKGLAEPMVKKLKENDIIQFTRFGFCRLDKKEKNILRFWYTHK